MTAGMHKETDKFQCSELEKNVGEKSLNINVLHETSSYLCKKFLCISCRDQSISGESYMFSIRKFFRYNSKIFSFA